MPRGRAPRHGLTDSPEWKTWTYMKGRCYDPHNASFKSYGAKGIIVCERWLKFENFLEDMGKKPTPLHTIERVDSSKGYCKENCRWATTKEQGRNRSTNVWAEHNGERLLLTEWAQRLGMTRGVMSYWFRRYGIAETIRRKGLANGS